MKDIDDASQTWHVLFNWCVKCVPGGPDNVFAHISKDTETKSILDFWKFKANPC